MKLLKNIFSAKQKNISNFKLNLATRPLPHCDSESPIAKNMTLRQLEIYFSCIDLAAMGGFAYDGGSLGGGSMCFQRERNFVQKLAIYVDESEDVNLYIRHLSNIKTIENEQMSEISKYANKRMYEDILTLMNIPLDAEIETLAGSCILRIHKEDNSLLFKTNFSHVRTHIAMALDLCDAVDRYAAGIIENSNQSSSLNDHFIGAGA